jgi:serine/threonine-protein kinase
VYLAEDLKHHRQVAVKVLRPELASALGPERFHREIKIAARLTHPHILPLHDSGESNGFLYYVMPYVEGESLADRLSREKQLPVDDALRLAREVSAGLDYAHRHDVVHRDIKPENIMLHDGSAMVTDFGIGKAVSAAGGDEITQTGVTIGTPAYMSPEQAASEPEIDGRSDLYSLGCVLYEMLAGEPLFTGPTPQAIIAKRFTQTPPDLCTTRETIPPGIAQAVKKLLASRWRRRSSSPKRRSRRHPKRRRSPSRCCRLPT